MKSKIRFNLRVLLFAFVVFSIGITVYARYYQTGQLLTKIRNTGCEVTWHNDNLFVTIGPYAKYAPVSTDVGGVGDGGGSDCEFDIENWEELADSLLHLGKPIQIMVWQQNLKPSHFRRIASIGSMKVLQMSYCTVSEAGISQLCTADSLEKIVLVSCEGIEGSGIARLKDRFSYLDFVVD